VNSPRWTDEELLRELGAALAEQPADGPVIAAAQAALSWQAIDAELELLYLETGLRQPAGVRGTASGERAGQPETLTFTGGRLSVQIQVDAGGVVGQLIPAEPGQVTLVTADGGRETAATDEVGGFTFGRPRPGPLRLECRVGDDRFATEWVTP